jgi:Zn-dependent protease with chaperone function
MYWNLELAWDFVLLTSLVVLPITLTLRLRRIALASPEKDRTGAWFTFMRSLRWTLLGAVVLWWAMTDFVRLQGFTFGVSGYLGLRGTTLGAVADLLFIWSPMFVVLVACTVLSQPVYACVRGLTWTRADLAKLGLLRLGMTYIPLLIILAGGGQSFSNDDWLTGYLVCFAVAAGIFFFSLRFLRAMIDWKPEALSRGELRDRAFELAGKLKVKLRQIYVVPAGKMRMANAFASSSDTILLTDYLVSQLKRREVDAIIAHELGHLRHKHAKLRGVMAGVMGGMLVFYLSIPSLPFRPLIDIALALAWFCTFYFVSRRCEFTADAEGAKLVGDPEALISGLARTHSLNLMPVQWGKWNETLMTHPSTVRRANAIARRAGLPIERVPGILQSVFSASPLSGEEHYSLPERAPGAAKIFSSQFKRRAHWRIYLASLASVAAVPVAAVWAIRQLGWPMEGWLICCGALLPTVLVSLLLQNFLPFVGHGPLEARLRRRAQDEGADTERWGGVFVGLSPGAVPRLYEASYSWDLGFLFIAGGRLCYWGEEIRFGLRRDELSSLESRAGIQGWLSAPRVYVTARSDANGRSEVFSLSVANAHSVVQMSRANRALAARVEGWRLGERGLHPVPQALCDLSFPRFGAVTGAPLGRPKWRLVLRQFVLVGFLAGCASALAGLPIDFASPIAHLFGLVPPDRVDLWGWFSLLSAWLGLLFWLAPSLMRRKFVASRQLQLESRGDTSLL